MKNRIEALSFAVLAVALCGNPAAAAPSPQRIAVPLSQPGKPARLELSLIQGGVEIEAYEGKEVVVEARPADEPTCGATTRTTTTTTNTGGAHRAGPARPPACGGFPTTASA